MTENQQKIAYIELTEDQVDALAPLLKGLFAQVFKDGMAVVLLDKKQAATVVTAVAKAHGTKPDRTLLASGSEAYHYLSSRTQSSEA